MAARLCPFFHVVEGLKHELTGKNPVVCIGQKAQKMSLMVCFDLKFYEYQT